MKGDHLAQECPLSNADQIASEAILPKALSCNSRDALSPPPSYGSLAHRSDAVKPYGRTPEKPVPSLRRMAAKHRMREVHDR